MPNKVANASVTAARAALTTVRHLPSTSATASVTPHRLSLPSRPTASSVRRSSARRHRNGFNKIDPSTRMVVPLWARIVRLTSTLPISWLSCPAMGNRYSSRCELALNTLIPDCAYPACASSNATASNDRLAHSKPSRIRSSDVEGDNFLGGKRGRASRPALPSSLNFKPSFRDTIEANPASCSTLRAAHYSRGILLGVRGPLRIHRRSLLRVCSRTSPRRRRRG